ncbi:MAG: hypothetical protein HW405_313 [Candidatus Berkelbacteria bacterium]|nr:hypothetical protein [Candidatus Berkelbacteria bacterium]
MQEEQYTFENQRPDEDVIFVKKRHPWVLSRAGFIIIVLVIVLVVSIMIFGFSNVSSIVIILIIIFGVLHTGYLWFLYSNYLYILTNQRLIIIEQSNIFSRKLSESELDKIQNITVEVKGPIKTFLNFGNIKITTAGVDPIMILENVEDPYKLQQEIIKYSKNVSDSLRPYQNQNIIR